MDSEELDRLAASYAEVFGVAVAPQVAKEIGAIQEIDPEWSLTEAFLEAKRKRIKRPLAWIRRVYEAAKAQGRLPDWLADLADAGSARSQFRQRYGGGS